MVDYILKGCYGSINNLVRYINSKILIQFSFLLANTGWECLSHEIFIVT